MIKRIIGFVLLAWGGLVLVKFAVRLFAGVTAPDSGGTSMYGNQAAYEAGRSVGSIFAFFLAVIFVLIGLGLMFAPRPMRKPKPRKFATPKGFKD